MALNRSAAIHGDAGRDLNNADRCANEKENDTPGQLKKQYIRGILKELKPKVVMPKPVISCKWRDKVR
jgi:hypothetical protein